MHPAPALLVPAEPDDAVVAPVQDPGLAGAGLRAPVGVPAGQRVRAVGRASGPASASSRHGPRVAGSAGPARRPAGTGHPGTAVPWSATRRRARRPARRKKISSSSIASSALTNDDRHRRPEHDRRRRQHAVQPDAGHHREQRRHGARRAGREPPTPNVYTAIGSATRITSGHTTAASRPSSKAQCRGLPPGRQCEAGQRVVEQEQRGRRGQPDEQETGERAAAADDPCRDGGVTHGFGVPTTGSAGAAVRRERHAPDQGGHAADEQHEHGRHRGGGQRGVEQAAGDDAENAVEQGPQDRADGRGGHQPRHGCPIAAAATRAPGSARRARSGPPSRAASRGA